MKLSYGSLFAGIAGDKGFDDEGWECRWQVEKDAFCRAVLETHFPKAKRFKDVRDCGSSNLEKVDCIIAGVPCQDVSVAGKRAGLAGERTGLFWEYIRILKELKPSWTVFENVPGLLSSNDGQDFETVLEAFNDAGYVLDGDILDSQYFGVAQRRRRIFLVCARLDGLLSMKINSSGQILASLTAETLRNAWVAIQPASFHEVSLLDCENPIDIFAGSARKRIDSLWRMLERFGRRKSLTTWGEGFRRHSDVPNFSESACTWSANRADTRMNTAIPLNDLLADVCLLAKPCITSIWIEETARKRICVFSLLSLSTWRRIIPLIDSSGNCSVAELSCLTAMKASIDYARYNLSSLFTPQWERDFWRDYLGEAEPFADEFERSAGAECPAEILFDAESSGGDSAARGEAGQDFAGTLGTSADRITGKQGQLAPDIVRQAISSKWAVEQPAVAFALRSDPGGTGQGHNTTYAVTENMRNRSQGPGNYVETAQMSVRRLTPTECEILQGFTIQWHTVIIDWCFGHPRHDVDAVRSNLKSPKNASNVEGGGSPKRANYAGINSQENLARTGKHVPDNVHIVYGASGLRLRLPGKSFLSVSSAAETSEFRQPTAPESFARVVAGLTGIVDRVILHGKVELRQSGRISIHRLNGLPHVRLYGSETMLSAEDVGNDSNMMAGQPTKSTTSKHLPVESIGLMLATSFLSVIRAIGGFIPKQTIAENSFRLRLTYETAWTVPIGTPITDSRFPLLPKGLDSARYRALGNAITVSVGRWIAKRIADYERKVNA